MLRPPPTSTLFPYTTLFRSIDSATGKLTVANSSLLDYEVATSHGIVVRVTDQGGLFLDKTGRAQLSTVVTHLLSVTYSSWISNGNDTLTGTTEADTIKGLGG